MVRYEARDCYLHTPVRLTLLSSLGDHEPTSASRQITTQEKHYTHCATSCLFILRPSTLYYSLLTAVAPSK